MIRLLMVAGLLMAWSGVAGAQDYKDSGVSVTKDGRIDLPVMGGPAFACEPGYMPIYSGGSVGGGPRCERVPIGGVSLIIGNGSGSAGPHCEPGWELVMRLNSGGTPLCAWVVKDAIW